MPPTAFSSAIAGPMGQSLVAQLQDDDMTLHQQLQEFLQMRVRADRKYAQQLLKIAAHFRPRGSASSTSVLNDTQVYKAWQALIAFTEEFAQAVLQDSSILHSKVKVALENLIQEKGELRKNFLHRKQQHESQLQQIDAAEAEQKSDLMRAARRATEERARFLTTVQRLNNSNSALEKSSSRDKYRSSLRRVHNAHNAYVLILEEANAHCQLFEATSLPKWLDLQQQLMQLQVEQSKFILNEIYCRLTHSDDQVRQLISRTLNEISLIDPATEFESFLEANKSPCVATCLREYDDKLLVHYQGNSLQEHRLILNELTNNNLEKSKRRYDNEKVKHMELLNEKAREAEKENEVVHALRQREEEGLNDAHKEELRRRVRQHLVVNQCEVDEQCRVDMYSKLLNVVSRTIDEGRAAHNGQLPPVQELVLSNLTAATTGGGQGGTLPPGTSPSAMQPGGPSLTSLNSVSSGKLWGRLRKSLSRSGHRQRARHPSLPGSSAAGGDSVSSTAPVNGATAAPPTSPAPPPPSSAGGNPMSAIAAAAAAVASGTGPTSLNHYSPTKAPPTPVSPTTKPRRGERKISQNSSGVPVELPPRPPIRDRFNAAEDEAVDPLAGAERRKGRVPEPPSRQPSAPGEKREPSRSPQRGTEPPLPGRHPSNPENDGPGATATLHPNRRELEKEPYFHGVLPRDEVQRLLREDGDFLVRESHNRRPRNGSTSESSGNVERPFVLSVYWQGYKHFIVQGQAGSWHFEGSGFATIPELIEHHLVTGERITGQSGASISNPVARVEWQLDNDDIQLGANIGRGNFGDVHVGWYNGKKVAVKTCREEVPEEMRRRFLDEGKILLKYNHRNIVRLIGIAAQRQPIMIVMEYVANGSLLNYLKRSKDLTRSTRLKICLDSANGMAYLESKNCIHRDLAARNCLVAEDHTIKIADFGMSREEEVYTVSEGLKQIPIKWTAPEALSTGHYTVKCDVWSYGVLMWEVYSKGSTPYLGLTNSQTREKVEAGHRMPAPEGTPSEVYDVMLRCWEAKPSERPSFGEIVAYLTRLHNDEMEGPETSLL